MIENIAQLFAVCNKGFFGLPPWYKYLSDYNEVTKTCSDISFGGLYDVFKILAAVIEILLRLGVLLAVGFIIYGGVKMIVSQGDPSGITSARDTIINAVIGLIITLLATTVVGFIANAAFK